MAAKERLDVTLVSRGLVPSREKAQALVLAGDIRVNGRPATKPGQPVDSEARLEIRQQLRYVSRGGLKLEAALATFGISVEQKVCLDIGTSTGGFADCLLQHGAVRVHCVDTGAGQIDWKLRNDPRIVLHENTNARYLSFSQINEFVGLIVCDVSFISVTLLIPALKPFLTEQGDWIILVKPQFEAGRESVGKGGIVRDPLAHATACQKVANALEFEEFSTRIIESPIRGVKGNREFLIHARRGRQGPTQSSRIFD
jgi:23S rRNA (cytidine1920-2'-O)/16S rRNA (cytidine1409-2'-O)-methyltransferase